MITIPASTTETSWKTQLPEYFFTTSCPTSWLLFKTYKESGILSCEPTTSTTALKEQSKGIQSTLFDDDLLAEVINTTKLMLSNIVITQL